MKYFYSMILIHIDKGNKQPLFQQVFVQLKQLIESGSLKAGENLPSTRKLAEWLGVHRTTIYRAYEELWAAGYLESTAGGYSRVRQRYKLAGKTSNKNMATFDWENHLSPAVKRINASYPTVPEADGVIDFRVLSPDPDLLPVDDFRKCVGQVLQTEGARILQYGNSLGYEPLREYLARQMQQHGIAAEKDEIILTNGMQNAIELVLRLLTSPGDTVITESPTYGSALLMMKYHGLHVNGIPVSRDGMDLALLEEQLKKRQAKLIYSIPTFHNPTGMSSSQSHREQLLALCEKYQVPLVEDGFEEEMKYFGKAVLPVKSMDRKKLVIYLGTFSKVLFPGIRVGWIVASRQLIKSLETVKYVTDLSGSPLTQAAVFQFCKEGFYELHKKRLHRVYRKRMQQALLACNEFLPGAQIQFSKPDGGYLIWLSFNQAVSEEEKINDWLIKGGVALISGSRFFPERPEQVHFRLSIAHNKEEALREGIRRIGLIGKQLNGEI